VIVAAITLIGLPLALMGAVVYLAMIYLGRITFAVWLGHALLRTRVRTERRGILARYVVGELCLIIVGLIPFLGTLAVTIATVFGIGALVLRLYALRETQHLEFAGVSGG
jgi:hypothetical protein